MADISKCDGKGCDRRASCYRFVATADKVWQSWIDPQPRGKDCTKFEDVRVPAYGSDQ